MPERAARLDEPTEQELLSLLERLLRSRLPSGWGLELVSLYPIGDSRVMYADASLTLCGPDKRCVSFIVEVKKSRLDPINVGSLLARAQLLNHPPEKLLVIAPFLGARTRTFLGAAGANYADATGNLRIMCSSPAIWIEAAGASTNPWHEERGLLSLKGPAAGRAVRALCDFRPPYSVTELAMRAQVSPATVSRIAQILEREALLTRNDRGAILDVRWADLLRFWTRDYALTTSNQPATYLEPRGLAALLRKLPQVGWQYAVTGSLAAARIAPLAAVRLGALYVTDRQQAAVALEIQPAERGANVLLLAPFDPVVFERARAEEGVRYTAYSQVVADLLTSPGRGPQEGEALLRWMEGHEDDWRA